MLNKILKSSVLRMIGALSLIGILSGTALVFVYTYAMPRIQANLNEETGRAIRSIFPDSSGIEKTGEKDVFRVYGAAGKTFSGYAFIAEGNGYQGAIKLIVGVDPEMAEMKGMEVLESQETPGLGAEIASDDFRGQFRGLGITKAIEYVKNRKPEAPNQIEAITGATISSRAVVNIINKKLEEMRGRKL